MSDRPDYLQPVPDVGATPLPKQPAAVPVEPTEANGPAPSSPGITGLTPPLGKGHSGMFLADVLVELGFVDKERVELALEESRGTGRTPESILVEQRVIDSNQLSRAVAERYGLFHLDLNSYKIDIGASNLISPSAARRYNAIPVGFMPDDSILLAMSDPSDVIAIDDVQMITGSLCRVAVAAPEDIVHKVDWPGGSRTFAGTTSSGVPMLQAIKIAGQTAGNAVVADAMDDVYNSVRNGGSIAKPLQDNDAFPAMVSHMVAVGEDSGQLETMLEKAADFYETEVDAKVRRSPR